MTKKKPKKENQKEIKADKYPDEFYFDDCPICKAMRAADERGRALSSEELKRAFKKANKKQK